MTQDKPVTVSMLGTDKTYETVVEPGDTPREVLARVVEGDHDNVFLRAGTGREFSTDTDVYRNVDDGEVLFSGKDAVVGGTTNQSAAKRRG